MERLLQALAGLGILRNGTDCMAKSSLRLFITQWNMYIVLEIYIHTFTYMLSYTSYICMGVCIGTHDGSPKFSVKKECIVCVCKKITTPAHSLSTEMGILQPSTSLLLNLSVVCAIWEESNFDLLTVQLLSEKG